MANPNIAAATSILGVTHSAALGTGTSLLLTVPSDTVYKINTISVCNITASTITVNLQGTFPSSFRSLVKDISIPATTTLVVTSKDTSFYLPETGSIYGGSSASSSAHIIISYEAIS